MKSLADQLPPEFAALIHPKWRKNEADYWVVREQLLEQYRDQWIGFADGNVVASGKSPVDVLHAAEDDEQYPCRLHVDFAGHERILGRDVMNHFDILFRGPAREIVVNP